MSGCGTHVKVENLWILWTQAHGTSKSLNCDLRFTVQDLHPATEKPRPRQVRVERESLIREGGAVIEIADDITEDKSGCTERDRVITSQLRRPSSQPFGFGDLLLSIGHPARRLPRGIAPRRHAISRREFRVEL